MILSLIMLGMVSAASDEGSQGHADCSGACQDAGGNATDCGDVCAK